MKYIDFGDDKISKLSLGTVQFGLNYGIANSQGQPTQKDVDEIIKYVSKNGVNCFDTAQAYGNSERVLGMAIKNIDAHLVISKLKSDSFKKNAIENVLSSLKNLNIDSLFALLLHDSDVLYNWTKNDNFTVEQLVRTGKIKYFGVSIYTAKEFELALKNEKINFIQIPFNLFDQRAIKEKWFEKAKKNNKLIFIRSIFLQGLLLMDITKIPKKLEAAKQYISIIESIANKLSMTRNQLALSFVDTLAENALLLFGCDSLMQAKENIQNYKTIRKLDNTTINEILDNLSNINEEIYNPRKW